MPIPTFEASSPCSPVACVRQWMVFSDWNSTALRIITSGKDKPQGIVWFQATEVTLPFHPSGVEVRPPILGFKDDWWRAFARHWPVRLSCEIIARAVRLVLRSGKGIFTLSLARGVWVGGIFEFHHQWRFWHCFLRSKAGGAAGRSSLCGEAGKGDEPLSGRRKKSVRSLHFSTRARSSLA